MKTATPRQARPESLPKTPTGIDGLDDITGGGFPSGRPTLICGSAGCGLTLLAMEFLVRGATKFGEPGVFMAFEETAEELAQNAKSLGFDLNDLVKRKLLAVDFVRVERHEIQETGEYDLEGLFVRLAHAIDAVGAKRVVIDMIETLFSGLSNAAILRSEIRRLLCWLKDRGVTAIITGERGEEAFTRLGLEENLEITDVDISSLVDTWVLLRDIEVGGERNRALYILKSRGMSHSNQLREFLLADHGFELLDVSLGPPRGCAQHP